MPTTKPTFSVLVIAWRKVRIWKIRWNVSRERPLVPYRLSTNSIASG